MIVVIIFPIISGKKADAEKKVFSLQNTKKKKKIDRDYSKERNKEKNEWKSSMRGGIIKNFKEN